MAIFRSKPRCNFFSIFSIGALLVLANIAIADNYQGFIIKFHDYQMVENKKLVKNKLSELTGVRDIEFKKIANGIYSFKLSKSLLENHGVIDKIKHDQSVKYFVPDRIGHFKPVKDPELIRNPKFNLNNYSLFNYKLDHSAQWDEFAPPKGIFLESKPYLSDGAWRYTTDGVLDNPVVVAVLDTGIEYNSNLTNNIVKKPESTDYFGWNFSVNNSDLSDGTYSYHGTHVAGTIAGHGSNVMGIAKNLQILPVKICNEDGMFFESNVIRGIYWAIGEPVDDAPVNLYPAKVINMSFGVDEYVGKEADYCSPVVQEAIDYARSKGVVMVVAAGNSNMEHDLGSPAGCTGTIRVASTGPTGLRSYFSNYGAGITLAAPGGDKKYGIAGGILSTVKAGEGIDASDYDFYQGTSMAAPHVAGLAGLLYSVNDLSKNYTAHDIENLLYTTTHDFGMGFGDERSCRGKQSCGHGIINANNALEAGIANYDILFSAPKPDFLNLERDAACNGQLVSASNTNIIKAEGTWVLVEDTAICQNPLEFSHPTLKINEQERKIYATYGQVVYRLNYNHSYCKQIGYDGIGCYK